jgi:hypothetical protein
VGSIADIDYTLQIIVGTINTAGAKGENDVRFGITLSMPSGVVTGSLIPAPVWLTEVAALVQQASGGENESPWAWFLKQQLDLYQSSEEDDKDASEEDDEKPSEESNEDSDEGAGRTTTAFIHLRNARFFVGTQLAPNAGMHWRGRLSDVTGWAPGELG